MSTFPAARRVALGTLLSAVEAGVAGLGWLGAIGALTLGARDCVEDEVCGCGRSVFCDVPALVFVLAALLGVARAVLAHRAGRAVVAGRPPRVRGYLAVSAAHAVAWIAIFELSDAAAGSSLAAAAALAAWPLAFAVIAPRLVPDAPVPLDVGVRPLLIVALAGFLVHVSWVVSLPIVFAAFLGGSTLLIMPGYAGLVVVPLWMVRGALAAYGELLWTATGARVVAGWLLLGSGLVALVTASATQEAPVAVVAAIQTVVGAALLRMPPDRAPVPPARVI